MKKTFIVTYEHNYGLGVAIINTTSIEKANELCKNHKEIWDGYYIEELDNSLEVQILNY